jgi:hypothetical protein
MGSKDGGSNNDKLSMLETPESNYESCEKTRNDCQLQLTNECSRIKSGISHKHQLLL